MKKFRIKEITYVDGNVNYYIQRRYLGFIWLNVKMILVDYLSTMDRYISELNTDVNVCTYDLRKAKNIKNWIEMNPNNRIGYNDNGDVIYLYWLKNESEAFNPKYLGSCIYENAIEKQNNYINNSIDSLKRKKINYIY